MSRSTQIHAAEERAERIRELLPQFRILMIGRANAGKTTILQRICNTTENPRIFSQSGEEIKLSVLDPSTERGEHDIENQMVFGSNPGFIFHDSRGFESGSTTELEAVKSFITKYSEKARLRDQLHAIWYCIPATDDRPITRAETDFFEKIGTGAVSVIVLFTKTDALDSLGIRQLINEGISREEAMQRGPQVALDEFQRTICPQLANKPYPPKEFVFLKDMQCLGADCRKLIAKTAASLDNNDTLQQLFVSTQKKSMEVCIKYAVEKWIRQSDDYVIKFTALAYFPHVLPPPPLLLRRPDLHLRLQDLLLRPDLHQRLQDLLLRPDLHQRLQDLDLLLRPDLHQRLQDLDLDLRDLDLDLRDLFIKLDHVSSLDFWNKLGGVKTPITKAACYITMAIIAEHSFFLWEPQPSSSPKFFTDAFAAYKLADISTTIQKAVQEAFNQKQDVAQVLPDLIQIALDNRLSKDQQHKPSMLKKVKKLFY